MDELLKILDTAKALVAQCIAQQKALTQESQRVKAKEDSILALETSLQEKKAELDVREQEVNSKFAKVDLAQDLHAAKNKVEQMKIDLENERTRMLQDVAKLRSEAQGTLQQAQEIKASAVSLQIAVEKEKAEYKTKILEEITKKVGAK